MAEQKFYDAEKLSELSLMNNLIQERESLLHLYLDAVKQQDKIPSLKLTLEYIEINLDKNFEIASYWFKFIEKINDENFLISRTRIHLKIAEKSGEVETIYNEIKKFKLKLIELHKPIRFEFIENLVSKYFKKDLDLKILELGNTLTVGNLRLAEEYILEFIQDIFQGYKYKNKRDNLLKLGTLLESHDGKKHLEIYQNFCFLYYFGIKEKKDYKKIIELLIYSQEFKFQLLLLILVDHLNLTDIASDFSKSIIKNKKFNFIIITKNYPHLKKYFITPKNKSEKEVKLDLPEDAWGRKEFVEKSEAVENVEYEFSNSEVSIEEFRVINSLKFQELNEDQLINLASSFIQSEYFKAVQFTLDLALKYDLNNEKYLHVLYLKSLASFKLKEFRTVLDLGIEALSKQNNENSILNFLHLIGESYYFLGKKREALISFRKIENINQKFRNVQERIKELNEA